MITTDTLVIELNLAAANIPVALRWATTMGISMTSSPYCCKDVKMETYDAVNGWSTKYDATNNSTLSVHQSTMFGDGNTITKLRWTLKNFVGGVPDVRIDSLFVHNYLSELGSALFLPRTGGNLYGTAAAPPTLTAFGYDGNIDLSLSGRGTGGVRIPKINDSNGRTVLTVSSATNAVNYVNVYGDVTGAGPQIVAAGTDTNVSLNLYGKGTGTVNVNGNPVVTRVSVPATATSTGTAGQIAYDSSYFYICTASNTWRRAAIASW